MSTDLTILIIGVVLILIALIGNIKVKDSSVGLIPTNLKIPLGLLGIFMIIYSGYSYGNINVQGQIEQVAVGNKLKVDYPVQKIQVISPLDGDEVKCRILSMGVYPDQHGKDIWVVLKPSDEKYYPQSDHTNTSYKKDGEWQVITRFGGDQAESYDLIVYETDAVASEFFSNTIENWKQVETYEGLTKSELPSGAKELDRITVSLKENCRGVH